MTDTKKVRAATKSTAQTNGHVANETGYAPVNYDLAKENPDEMKPVPVYDGTAAPL